MGVCAIQHRTVTGLYGSSFKTHQTGGAAPQSWSQIFSQFGMGAGIVFYSYVLVFLFSIFVDCTINSDSNSQIAAHQNVPRHLSGPPPSLESINVMFLSLLTLTLKVVINQRVRSHGLYKLFKSHIKRSSYTSLVASYGTCVYICQK